MLDGGNSTGQGEKHFQKTKTENNFDFSEKSQNLSQQKVRMVPLLLSEQSRAQKVESALDGANPITSVSEKQFCRTTKVKPFLIYRLKVKHCRNENQK